MMKNIFKNKYNKRSAKKYGWDPSWFGAIKFDDELIEKIEKFQEECGLKQDGLVGPMTYRRINTSHEEEVEKTFTGSGIICNGVEVPIGWDKIRYDFLPESCYKKPPFWKKIRKPTMVVTHWDACLSAKSCRRVLERRGISSHFVIDNDGTIVQMADCNDICWHAGRRKVNNVSIGIDFSNAVYMKYQKWYRRNNFGNRPILGNVEVHGRTLRRAFLGFYPQQIEAYKALLLALHTHYDIPLECLLDEDGRLDTGVNKSARSGKFRGVINHYNISDKKWDAAGLELDSILKEIRDFIGE